MKNSTIGFLVAVVLLGVALGIFKYAPSLFSVGPAPVTSDNLIIGSTDFGSLTVLVYGKGQPLSDVEVDLGTVGANGPTGSMSYTVTDANGVATFSKVPVGSFDIFFNTNRFPTGYAVPPQSKLPSVQIIKDQQIQKRIDLNQQ
ncbi:hypothetical protein A3G63_00570 [Candidatus Kaiserbacteria bacterium RIFCSPLOWO2_12_FULL_52_8]|uniref:Carboxypeptidase regulatory-like domain-containing protein n=1 Tax=Candidatus Kaiserbacteria bacterium RIFCSPHIGHO2_01_FULL_53_31 TaxID=1798481 RepID=A0A1F6CIG6_9BACT|nr:MAG: hypothetical protein A2678_01140 [Candidatus Kaiserbacteria bacterium RIFCSPHIGHO2_01_FULL_53_31]OGG92655.1 MAG: hypothetical protein A3G63_00570 [Candidatus Kaiserbacteria bacterium RIFCSPLOWO2_12_FULL_52_8]